MPDAWWGRMLGELGPQRGLLEADRLYLNLVGPDT